MPQLALAVQERGILSQVLAIHDQMLPVHVDLKERRIDSQAAHAVNGVERGSDVAHQNIHSRFAVFVFQEHRYTFISCVSYHFTYSIDKQIPRLRVLSLEVIVVALRAGPDDEVRPQRSCQVNAALQRLDTFTPQRQVRIDERSQLIRWIGV